MSLLNLQLEIPGDFALASTPNDRIDSNPVIVEVPATDVVKAHNHDFKLAIETMQVETDQLAFSIDSPNQVRQRHIRIHVVDRRFKYPTWMHPNIGGEAQHIQSSDTERDEIQERLVASKHNLSEWNATAISGNDIMSSVLFTAGLTTAKAGKLAPVAQAMVVIVIYCMRWVQEEVMSAIPLNGGFYSAILNSSSKRVAAIAAIFSILSYLATGVVCGVAAFNYLNTLVAVPVVVSTVGMLLVFALLCLMGIAESATVALVFFVVHLATLTLLCITSIVYAAQHPSIFMDNMHTAIPDITALGHAIPGNVFTALFYGYGTAMLGVTGFESSSQYVEEQAPGVFPKTLRNMWMLSSVYNIAFAFLSLAVVPQADIITHQDILLAYMGKITAGYWLQVLVSVDAFIVLAGAVLTSYVGITGLVQRLAIDRVLPRILARRNSCRGTTHYIILAYFLVASSLVVAMNGQISGLSGVFAFAFLGVLLSFVVGCFLLKLNRVQIPRQTTSSWINCLFCLVMLALCFLANALGDPATFRYFVLYYFAIGAIAFLMLERVWMLKAVLDLTRRFQEWRRSEQEPQALTTEVVGSIAVAKTIEKIKRTPTIFFCKAPNLPKINQAIAYVMQNEQTYCMRLVHVSEPDARIPPEFAEIVCLFDHIYPLLKIDFVSISGAFDPPMIEWIAAHLGVPTNMMFMRQPATAAMHAISSAGVRIITD